MKSDLLLEVLSHHGQIVKEDEVELVDVPTMLGHTTILSNHTAYYGAVQIGVLRYKKNGVNKKVAIGTHGIVEVFKNHVTIIVHTAERAENIDVARAKIDKEEALELISNGIAKTPGGFDVQLALKLANYRIALGEEIES
ncbi:MAG: F0F1 ATP synthase subunit epsilon [Fusobacteria bacterium]|nr:F0F1 ATP synthase subunit epsilon [Fusobacteriota bacterium]